MDGETSDPLLVLMRQLNREESATVVIVTHYSELALRTDCVIRMGDGRVVEDERLGRERPLAAIA